jgi:hypothetical protein
VDETPSGVCSQAAIDYTLEKIAHEHADWVQPHKKLFIGRLVDSDKIGDSAADRPCTAAPEVDGPGTEACHRHPPSESRAPAEVRTGVGARQLGDVCRAGPGLMPIVKRGRAGRRRSSTSVRRPTIMKLDADEKDLLESVERGE